MHDVEEQKRLKITEVVGKLLGSEIQRLRPEEHKLLFNEFLERFVDIKVSLFLFNHLLMEYFRLKFEQ